MWISSFFTNLHKVVKLRIGPHARLVRGRTAGILHLLPEAFNGFGICLSLNLLEHTNSLFFCVAADDETIEGEFDLPFATVLCGSLSNLPDLASEAFKSVAVHEVVVTDHAGILLGVVAVASLEDLGMATWPLWEVQRLWLERIVAELVEVAPESERVFCPDAFQALDEFAAAAVTFGVVQPPLPNAGELRKC